MSLRTYEEVRPYAQKIATFVEARYMPPWHASPDQHGVVQATRGTTMMSIPTNPDLSAIEPQGWALRACRSLHPAPGRGRGPARRDPGQATAGFWRVASSSASACSRFPVVVEVEESARPVRESFRARCCQIIYCCRVDAVLIIAEVEIEPFSASDPLELSNIAMRRLTNFDVTADGQRFLVTVPADSGDPVGTGHPAHASMLSSTGSRS